MKKTYWIILIVVVLALLVGGDFLLGKKTEKAVEFRTGKVEKGDLQVVVTATGILSADTTVAVGTQVSGIITKIFVDFNSVVRKGQRIAVLDTTFLAASVEDARSSLFRAQVQTRLTKRNFERNKTLFDEKVIAQADYDQSLSDYETAQANERSVKSALDRANINLRYATIIAPVSGVVISRNVDIGQTVASSFSTPTLFSIANDLTKMQLQASIDEADIGKIKVGQDVSFRVDAYIDQIFSGTVRQVRLQPVTLQNVVNYTVVIDVPNPEKKLMPGMTANLTVKIQEALNVFKAPSAALRFWPPQEYFDKHMKEYPDSIQKMIERLQKFMARRQSGQGWSGQAGSGLVAGSGAQATSGTQSGMGRQQGMSGQSGFGRQGGSGQQQETRGGQGNMQGRQGWGGQPGNDRLKMGLVWVKQGNLIIPHRIKTGISDNSSTEIEGSVKEGDELITGIVNTTPGQQTTQQQNPFAPQMGRPQGGGSGGRGGR
ncbi:MAG: efflux RND transporter periplasmic adaptor subunit [Bacteroidetes bacterium]|nr:efflux RND transporter periplasmic adaptor subunit [Bacteroidota bacterium]